MIKLIATDIDGTLVKDGSADINPEIFDVIMELKEKGAVFAAASGRQYPSIRRLFDPIHENMIFIAENGAYIKCRGVEMFKSNMDKEIVKELVIEARGFESEKLYLTVSTPECLYIETKDEEFYDVLVNGYRNNVKQVDDVLKEDLDVIKIALYKADGIRDIADNKLIPKWRNRLKVVMAGAEWLDFMDSSVDKGEALSTIQKALSISREETMAFGDNINDIGMLSNAGESYAVATAREELKAIAKHIAGSYLEDGVLTELKKLL
ncbi:Cof-type HAD-IIB family hydrolase [Konateibacter massiliensis]|uniref:Cof-type HAD-IIB family hydrolase n=1 Tax=Konateibacter massiliensis TaxID=2002841 RepID=UPI000C15E391|nr:Cof-type HAD-IIB family hydrolase [Konateibacter massiliensis]